MRAVLAGETVLDSRRGIVLWETGAFPAYYPLKDIRQDLLEPGPGTPRRRSVRVGARIGYGRHRS